MSQKNRSIWAGVGGSPSRSRYRRRTRVRRGARGDGPRSRSSSPLRMKASTGLATQSVLRTSGNAGRLTGVYAHARSSSWATVSPPVINRSRMAGSSLGIRGIRGKKRPGPGSSFSERDAVVVKSRRGSIPDAAATDPPITRVGYRLDEQLSPNTLLSRSTTGRGPSRLSPSRRTRIRIHRPGIAVGSRDLWRFVNGIAAGQPSVGPIG